MRTVSLLGSGKFGVRLLVWFFLGQAVMMPVFAQTTLNAPESVVWDATTRTYLVSNVNDETNGYILRRHANGTFTPFVAQGGGVRGPKGMMITRVGTTNVLWVVDVGEIKAFNLATAILLGTTPIPGSMMLLDIAADSSGAVYISDGIAGIFRGVIQSNFQLTVTNVVPGTAVNTPNGLAFDRATNRLIVVSYSGAGMPGTTPTPIYSLDLTTPTAPKVETVATPPNSEMDGIARDKEGRWYVSSWGTNNILRFDSFRAGITPTVVRTDVQFPADIFFNAATDTLAIPNLGRNTVDFIRISPPQVSSNIRTLDPSTFALRLAPNPAREQSVLVYRLPKSATVSVSLLNILGQTLRTSTLGNQAAGAHEYVLPLGEYPQGVYYCRIQAGDDISLLQIQIVR